AGGLNWEDGPVSPNSHAQGERPMVDAARAGDASALSGLYTLYFPRVYRYILARTGNTYDAEDLAEEVFMRVLEAIERSQWREGLAGNSQGADERVENRLALGDIREAAEKLPEAQRQVIALRFAAGLSVAETARTMGKGEGNVKVIQHKAIVKLREMMGQA